MNGDDPGGGDAPRAPAGPATEARGVPIDLPAAWRKVDVGDRRGVVLVVGATDVGKSTFATYL